MKRKTKKYHRIGNALNKRQCAFTLVELLVVISIISILIAILLPVLSAAREAARTIQCMSNQRQIGLSIQLFANDHDQYYPPMRNSKSWAGPLYLADAPNQPGHPGWIAWYHRLVHGDYISGHLKYYFGAPQGESNILICPDGSTKKNKQWKFKWKRISYGLSFGLTFDYGKSGAPVGLARTTDIKSPTQTVEMADTINNGGDGRKYNVGDYSLQTNGGHSNGGSAYPRHDGVCNVLWLDGHVSSVKAPNGMNNFGVSIYDKNALGNYLTKPIHWDRN